MLRRAMMAAPSGGGGSSVEVLTQQFNTGANAHNIAMPATVNAGDVLIVATANPGSSSGSQVTTPSGWTSAGNQRASGSACRLNVFQRVADGSEGGATVNFQTSAAVNMSATVWRVPAATGAPQGVGGADVSSSSPTPPAITPAWGAVVGTHGIVVTAFGTNTPSVTAYPFPAEQHVVTSTDGSSHSNLASCITTFDTATLTPGPFTLSASVSHVRATVAVRD